ncbi:MAG TPA: aminoglycoside phosphotransferase family protein [Propionibacteriaceae bacterium]
MRLPYDIPAEFAAHAALSPEWAAYLRRLPRLADELTDEWRLTYNGEPTYGHAGLVLPVLTDEGRPGVLKIGFLHEDGAGEPVALQLWGGRGAVELWTADPRRGALLLERLGSDDLTSIDVLEACDVVGELYGLLHRPPSPRLTDLRELLGRWLEDVRTLPRDAVPSRFVEQALAAAPRLMADEPSAVIHGDLHYENVLSGVRRPWLVIDPKGFAGDPAYELGPMLWNRWPELGDDPGAGIRERFYALVDASNLEERRCRDWVVVRSVVNVSWEHVAAAGRALSDAQHEWVTRCITTAKAMQDI